MKIKKLFLLGTALWFSSGSYCHIEASSSWQQAAESYANRAAYIGGVSAMAATILSLVPYNVSMWQLRLYGACAGVALGINLGLLSPKYRTLCALVAGIIGASIGSFVNIPNEVFGSSFYDTVDIHLVLGALASRAAGIEATVAIAVVSRMLKKVPALRVGTVVYAIMYGVLNYFCAAELGKLIIATIAAGTGAAVGGVVKLNKRRN